MYTLQSIEMFFQHFPEGLEFVDKTLPSILMFVPESYDATIGKKSTSFETANGPVKLKPLLNARFRNVLNDQMSGSIDVKIPFYGMMDIDGEQKMIVILDDLDGFGLSFLIMQPDEFDKNKVLDFLTTIHLDGDEDEDNEYED